MSDEPVMMLTARPGSYRRNAILAAISFAITFGLLASPACSQSLGDRFKSLFGGKPDEPAQGAPPAASDEPPGDLTCPPVSVQGRVVAGPAGAPSSVVVPMRVAVVQTGVQEKTIATKAYQTTVSMSEDGSVPFTLVVEDLVYPAPTGAAGDSYVFYIGFDPQALRPEPKPRATKKK